MNSSTTGYRARVDELESLKAEFETPTRPGDPAPLVGRALEATGNLLRRATSTPHDAALLRTVLARIPLDGLTSWADGLRVDELVGRFDRVVSTAMEAAIPDEGTDVASLRSWAMADLMARDRLESALVALTHSGRTELVGLCKRLRVELERVDGSLRRRVHGLTPLNAERRREAALLDVSARAQAWWLIERAGIEDDALVRVLGGDVAGTVGASERDVDALVNEKRPRPVPFEELLRYDLGLAGPAERLAVETGASRDLELKRAMNAMVAGEAAIAEALASTEVATPASPSGPPSARAAPVTHVMAERKEGTVLLFRAPTRLQVVLQPRGDGFREAALMTSDAPQRRRSPRNDVRGLTFDLGHPDALRGLTARVEVTQRDGSRWAVEVPLS